MDILLPTGINANKENKKLTLTWSDGHTSVYPFSLLRYACPCAECRDGYDQMDDEPPGEVFYMPDEDNPTTRLRKIENVGIYGVSILWEDGHQAGIFNWSYLRALCPCPICREMMIYGK